jgi:cytochrome b6-f complex iron-sulfur subunit
MENQPVSPSQRRLFLTWILGGIGVVLAAAAGWPVWRYLAPRKGAGEGATVTVPRDKVPLGGAHFFTFRGHPAVVLQEKAGEFTALTAVCTHLGCIVKWQKDKGEFLCPCHGGRFSAEGKVLGGPPPKPLESYPVNVQADNVVIG